MKKNKLLVISFAIILLAFACFGILKSNLFIDETYTFYMANGDMPPFAGAENSVKGVNMTDKIISRQDFVDLVSASDNRFDYKGVYRNHVQDVHPPLYAFILHTVLSLIGGGYSYAKYKAIALALNFIIYLLTLLVLYKLCQRLTGSVKISTVTVILYGLSALGISTAIMIRMYVLLTLFTVLLAYLIVMLLQTGKRYIYPLIALVIFSGLMTQYYFVFYSALLCALVCLYMLIKKQYKKMLSLALFALAGVACMYFAFPACIDHLFSGQLVSGQNAVNNLLNLTENAGKLINYLIIETRTMSIAVLIGFTAVILIIENGKFKDIKSIFRENDSVWQMLIIIAPAYIALLIIGIISPIFAERYVYNISPIIVLTVSLALYVLNIISKKETLLSGKLAVVLLAALVGILFVIRPSNLFLEYREYNNIIDGYADVPCIYFDNNFNAPLTNDAPQLIRFEDVFVSNNTNSEAMKNYLNKYGDPDEIIVYIDINDFWSSGYKADEILKELGENTGYKNHEKLFSSFLSETYIVSK